jgi:hypothetical protein
MNKFDNIYLLGYISKDMIYNLKPIQTEKMFHPAYIIKIKDLKPVSKSRLEEVKALIHKETKLNIGVYP